MRRSMISMVAVAALAAGLSACSSETSGNATPGDGTGGEKPSLPVETTEPSDESSTGSSADEDPLADLRPCDLLAESVATSLGLAGGREEEQGDARVCVYRHDGASSADSYTVQVELFSDQSIDEVVGTNATPVPKVGGHDAVQFTTPSGGCAIAMATSESSRVDAKTVGVDPANLCQVAAQVAAAVEPELP